MENEIDNSSSKLLPSKSKILCPYVKPFIPRNFASYSKDSNDVVNSTGTPISVYVECDNRSIVECDSPATILSSGSQVRKTKKWRKVPILQWETSDESIPSSTNSLNKKSSVYPEDSQLQRTQQFNYINYPSENMSSVDNDQQSQHRKMPTPFHEPSYAKKVAEKKSRQWTRGSYYESKSLESASKKSSVNDYNKKVFNSMDEFPALPCGPCIPESYSALPCEPSVPDPYQRPEHKSAQKSSAPLNITYSHKLQTMHQMKQNRVPEVDVKEKDNMGKNWAQSKKMAWPHPDSNKKHENRQSNLGKSECYPKSNAPSINKKTKFAYQNSIDSNHHTFESSRDVHNKKKGIANSLNMLRHSKENNLNDVGYEKTNSGMNVKRSDGFISCKPTETQCSNNSKHATYSKRHNDKYAANLRIMGSVCDEVNDTHHLREASHSSRTSNRFFKDGNPKNTDGCNMKNEAADSKYTVTTRTMSSVCDQEKRSCHSREVPKSDKTYNQFFKESNSDYSNRRNINSKVADDKYTVISNTACDQVTDNYNCRERSRTNRNFKQNKPNDINSEDVKSGLADDKYGASSSAMSSVCDQANGNRPFRERPFVKRIYNRDFKGNNNDTNSDMRSVLADDKYAASSSAMSSVCDQANGNRPFRERPFAKRIYNRDFKSNNNDTNSDNIKSGLADYKHAVNSNIRRSTCNQVNDYHSFRERPPINRDNRIFKELNPNNTNCSNMKSEDTERKNKQPQFIKRQAQKCEEVNDKEITRTSIGINQNKMSKHPHQELAVKPKTRKKRPSKIKRQVAFQTGKLLLLTPEFHSRITGQSAAAASKPSEDIYINMADFNEYPELGQLKLSTKCNINENKHFKKASRITDGNTSADSEKHIVKDSMDVAFGDGKSQEKQAVLKHAKDDSKEPTQIINRSTVTLAGSAQRKVHLVNLGVDDIIGSEDLNTTVSDIGDVDYCLDEPGPLTFMHILAASKGKSKKIKNKVEVKMKVVSTKRSKLNRTLHGPNVLDASAPVVKRGKERERPKKKKKTTLKKIILMERERNRDKLKALLEKATECNDENDIDCTNVADKNPESLLADMESEDADVRDYDDKIIKEETFEENIQIDVIDQEQTSITSTDGKTELIERLGENINSHNNPKVLNAERKIEVDKESTKLTLLKLNKVKEHSIKIEKKEFEHRSSTCIGITSETLDNIKDLQPVNSIENNSIKMELNEDESGIIKFKNLGLCLKQNECSKSEKDNRKIERLVESLDTQVKKSVHFEENEQSIIQNKADVVSDVKHSAEFASKIFKECIESEDNESSLIESQETKIGRGSTCENKICKNLELIKTIENKSIELEENKGKAIEPEFKMENGKYLDIKENECNKSKNVDRKLEKLLVEYMVMQIRNSLNFEGVVQDKANIVSNVNQSVHFVLDEILNLCANIDGNEIQNSFIVLEENKSGSTSTHESEILDLETVKTIENNFVRNENLESERINLRKLDNKMFSLKEGECNKFEKVDTKLERLLVELLVKQIRNSVYLEESDRPVQNKANVVSVVNQSVHFVLNEILNACTDLEGYNIRSASTDKNEILKDLEIVETFENKCLKFKESGTLESEEINLKKVENNKSLHLKDSECKKSKDDDKKMEKLLVELLVKKIRNSLILEDNDKPVLNLEDHGRPVQYKASVVNQSVHFVLNEILNACIDLEGNSSVIEIVPEEISSCNTVDLLEDETLSENPDALSKEDKLKAVQIVLHTKNFREYCNHLLSKELNDTVLALIEDLARFQDRLHLKDPVKARMKRRLVYGIKEITKHIKLKKLKCIIIAPDLENIKAEGGLNDALGNIIRGAADHHITCVYAICRKLLGKVCRKPVPVSCVGVFNYEGSEGNFKKIMDLHEESLKDYKELREKITERLQDIDAKELLEAHDCFPHKLYEIRTEILRAALLNNPGQGSSIDNYAETKNEAYETFTTKYVIKSITKNTLTKESK